MPNDFMREYEKHLNDPAVRLKRLEARAMAAMRPA